MSSRHLLAVALSGLLLSGTVVAAVPDASATPAPTPAQLAEAQRRVSAAQQGLADVQDQAEAATEAYNEALDQAEAAAAAAQSAGAAAGQALAVADQAKADAAAAQGIADAAAAAATAARQAHDRAVAAVDAAQAVLDGLASGAYRAGGNLALLSTMLANDPVGFATGQAMINRVDEHQKGSLDALAVAKAQAASTAQQADQAEATATAKAVAVAERAADAVSTAAAARTAAAAAAQAAAASTSAAKQAAASRAQAVALVTRAEASLGSATASAASLAAQAEQARREAAAARQAIPKVGQPVSGSAAAVAIAAAYSVIGTPYSWGGGNASGPTRGIAQGAGTVGFDCSGLMVYAWAHAGVSLPRSSRSQYFVGRHVGFDQLQPGDLIFYASNTSLPSSIHHVTMYLGGGKMIEAPHTGSVVKVSTVYRNGFIGGTRLTG